MQLMLLFRTNRRSDERGQVLVLAAIMMTVLLATASVAVDMGRFVGEKRFLQNAADAATLAAAFALAQGRPPAEAEVAARQALTQHFANEPTGNPASQPSATPIYDPACGTAPNCLIEGILISGAEVRVALRNDVSFTFGQVVGMDDRTITARARAGPDPGGGLVPIAVREFIQPPGPHPGATTPCAAYDPKKPIFTAVFAAAATSCRGSETDTTGRVDASVASPGQSVEIVGSGAESFNAKDFDGIVMLDIRNFASATSRQYYNTVTSGTNDNTLKDVTTAYIQYGYPGPPFPTVPSLPHPDWQVAALQGVSVGHWRPDLLASYAVGDRIIVLVYNGRVLQTPEFFMSEPAGVSVSALTPTASTTTNVSSNKAFTGTVAMSALKDPLDVVAPTAITVSPTSVTPTSDVTISASYDPTVLPGIYAMWVEGRSALYSFHVKRVPLSVNVGGVASDFKLAPCCEVGATALVAGDPANFTATVADTGSVPLTSVNLTAEDLQGNPIAATITPATVTAFPATVSISIDTSGLSSGVHNYVLRGRATLADGITTVTHILPLTVNVSPTTSPGKNDYVDVKGFALMEITKAASNENSVHAKALTPILPSMDHQALMVGRDVRLLPWDYSP